MKHAQPRRIHTRITVALLSIAAFAPVGEATAQQASSRIAVVDLERVIVSSKEGKALQTRLETFQQEVEAELTARGQALNAMRERFSAASGTERNELQARFEEARAAAARYQDEKQRESQRIQNEALKPVQDALGPLLNAIREERGLDVILNQSAPAVLVVNPQIDITQTVIDRLAAR
jgi:outer membrane protein